jgi:hypothetical protein
MSRLCASFSRVDVIGSLPSQSSDPHPRHRSQGLADQPVLGPTALVHFRRTSIPRSA